MVKVHHFYPENFHKENKAAIGKCHLRLQNCKQNQYVVALPCAVKVANGTMLPDSDHY